MESQALTDFDFEKHQTIAVDVDGTLIIWGGDRPGIPNNLGGIANEGLIRKLTEWKTSYPDHRTWIVWSGNGQGHAERICTELGIHSMVEILPKPTAIIDDTLDWFDEQSIMIDPTK